jgi:peptidoglycan/LPS O-acetylase OafA/YrhL
MSVSVPIVREATSSIRKFLQLDLLDNRYPALHGMRVLAIATVVQFHVTQISQQEPDIALDPQWAEMSMNIFFGMDLFFVLSGFLIGSILLRSIETSGSQQVRRFYLRRAFRTFPSYYVTLTYLYFVHRLTDATHPIRHNILFEYAYLTDYGYPRRDFDVLMPWGWSLAVEEKFYLAVPLLFLLLRKLRTDRGRLAALGAMWASALGVRLAIYLSKSGWTDNTLSDEIYFRSHTRYDTLVAGIILAYVQHRWREPIARWLEGRAPRAILGGVVLGCLVILVYPRIFGEANGLLLCAFLWGTVTTIMYFALVLLVINRQKDSLPRFLSAKPFRQLATLGYGVYLVHIPACFWFVIPVEHWLRTSLGWSMGAIWPTALILLLGLSFWWAYWLHLLIEKPSLRLRDRLAG